MCVVSFVVMYRYILTSAFTLPSSRFHVIADQPEVVVVVVVMAVVVMIVMVVVVMVALPELWSSVDVGVFT